MKIYRPLQTDYLSQNFGENKAMIKLQPNGIPYRPFIVKSNHGGILPDGWKWFYEALGMKGHNGTDWVCWYKEPIYFSADISGVTWRAYEASDSDGGLGVDVVSEQKVTLGNRTDYIKFRFWHFESVAIKSGEQVRFGQVIGFGDSTGASSGNHLHWGMKWCEHDGTALDKTNGYYGAFDMGPWFENAFTLDVLMVQAQALSAIQLARKVILQVQLYLRNRIGGWVGSITSKLR
jgi:murein DD-endopeptidase MepM/ murein hydrolase activator NlpD